MSYIYTYIHCHSSYNISLLLQNMNRILQQFHSHQLIQDSHPLPNKLSANQGCLTSFYDYLISFLLSASSNLRQYCHVRCFQPLKQHDDQSQYLKSLLGFFVLLLSFCTCNTIEEALSTIFLTSYFDTILSMRSRMSQHILR